MLATDSGFQPLCSVSPSLLALAVKANFSTQCGTTTCGSAALETYVAPYDATVVARLQAVRALIGLHENNGRDQDIVA